VRAPAIKHQGREPLTDKGKNQDSRRRPRPLKREAVDMKLEIIVIPSRMSIARKRSTQASVGGSTPTPPPITITA
jgi:hypothetical protein